MPSSSWKCVIALISLMVLTDVWVNGCLITNCPRGGKRSSKFGLNENIKQCISCGPGRSGQCFGPRICCGPFGCLIGTRETFRCQREGNFQDPEPCLAGSMNCRKNTGRCAIEGICCTQESCEMDKQCLLEDKKLIAEDLFSNLLAYQNDIGLDK